MKDVVIPLKPSKEQEEQLQTHGVLLQHMVVSLADRVWMKTSKRKISTMEQCEKYLHRYHTDPDFNNIPPEAVHYIAEELMGEKPCRSQLSPYYPIELSPDKIKQDGDSLKIGYLSLSAMTEKNGLAEDIDHAYVDQNFDDKTWNLHISYKTEK